MGALSRRNFLYAGGAAAAGAAAFTGPLGHVAAGGAKSGAAVPEAEVWEPDGEEQMVMYVSNPAEGEVTVMTDGHEIVFHDRQLVARVQRAAKKAGA